MTSLEDATKYRIDAEKSNFYAFWPGLKKVAVIKVYS